MTESTAVEFYNSDQVKAFARDDLNLFSALAAADAMTLQFPDFYQWLWRQLTEILQKEGRSFDRYALGLPRGHAKTTLVKLLICYIVLHTDRRYVLVIGANTKKAEAIIADVCDMLDSFNVQQIYGNWRYDLQIDRQDLKKFTFNGRPVILEAAGYGTAIRGSNQKNERPDVIVFDDAQTKDCALSQTEALAFQQWFLGTAMKAKSPLRCLFLYIGNMYKDVEIQPGVYGCMLRNLQKNPAWISFIVGAILEDGTALWEELQPLEQLLEELRLDASLGQADIFFAEVLNCPNAVTNLLVDTSKFEKHISTAGEIHDGCYIVIDPATSKRTPDQVVILYNELYDNLPVAREMLVGKFTAPEIVHEAIKMALRRQCSLIVVEANAYQYSLCEWFQFVIDQMNIHGLHVEPLYTRGMSKNSRILTFFKAAVTGQYRFDPDVLQQFVHQAAMFDPKRNDNLDDILDCGEMSLQSAAKFRGLIPLPGNYTPTGIPDYELPTQLTAPTPSSF
jgi:hypothetical protein